MSSLLVDKKGRALFFEPGGNANAEFIANARTDMPRLLAYCSDLENENERLQEEVCGMKVTIDLLEINVRTGKPAIVTAPKGDE